MDYQRLQTFYAQYYDAVRPYLEKFQNWVTHCYFNEMSPWGYRRRRWKPDDSAALCRELSEELRNADRTRVATYQLPSALRDALAGSLNELEYRANLWANDQLCGIDERASLAFLDCQLVELKQLVAAGYQTIRQIDRAPDRALTRLPGIKNARLKDIRQSIGRHHQRHPAPIVPQPSLFSA